MTPGGAPGCSWTPWTGSTPRGGHGQQVAGARSAGNQQSRMTMSPSHSVCRPPGTASRRRSRHGWRKHHRVVRVVQGAVRCCHHAAIDRHERPAHAVAEVDRLDRSPPCTRSPAGPTMARPVPHSAGQGQSCLITFASHDVDQCGRHLPDVRGDHRRPCRRCPFRHPG